MNITMKFMLSYTITYDSLCCSSFTGHEHIYALGLINMNGRMYNPLKYVDPSEECYFE